MLGERPWVYWEYMSGMPPRHTCKVPALAAEQLWVSRDTTEKRKFPVLQTPFNVSCTIIAARAPSVHHPVLVPSFQRISNPALRSRAVHVPVYLYVYLD